MEHDEKNEINLNSYIKWMSECFAKEKKKKMKNDEISYHSSFFNFFFFAASLGKEDVVCAAL